LLFDVEIGRRPSLDKQHHEADLHFEVGQLKITLDKAVAAVENLDRKLDKLHQDSLRASIALYWRLIDHQDALEPVLNEIKCELCKYTGAEITYKKYYSNCMFGGGRLKRYQCPNCDVIFGPEKILVLTEDELTLEYNMHYSAFKEGESKEREIRAFKSLKPHKDGIYLNYGAGSWSSTVPTLREEGWNIVAYEPHAAAATCNWSISDINVLKNMKFDGIFTNNVLEHFRDPVLELQKISELLKPGASMAHATPCYEYLYEFTRFHLFFFVGRSRNFMIKEAGLKQEEFVVDGDFMNLILSRSEK
jgi:SAM-dependent methyltransferase